MSHVEPSVEAKAAPIPAAKAGLAPGGSPRFASRTPFRTVAPTMTGRATWRESTFASSRSNPRSRAAASVAPLRETPGMSEAAWARPSATASPRPASSRRRPVGPTWSAHAIAADPISRPTAIVGGVPSRRSIGRSSVYPTKAGGRNDPATSARRRGVTSRTSSRNATSSAAAVPACRATSKALRSSLSSSAYSQPASHGTSVTWPEEEMGSSSAGPCSSPSASACRTLGVLRRDIPAAARPPPPHDQVRDAREDHGGDGVVHVVQGVLPVLPVLPRLHPDEGEHEDPREAARERQDAEAHERHPGDAGGQRDERPDDRQHPREEDGPRAPAREPAVGALEVARLDVQELPVLLEHLG